ncbi:hypothetical protein FPQ18DRAFT_267391 [Pyronema domesticum]|nr:hypothetical protein FPQ18DRAFT_267391 [Pyronema domesticum]
MNDITPNKGDTLHDEIRCYALPYGVIGLSSHVLTYYTIWIISRGRSPFLPWKKLNSPIFDMLLGAVGLLFGGAVTIFTMIRCHQRWQFVLIAIWKAMLSLTIGALSVHAAVIVKRESFEELLEILWWLLLYVAGSIVGLTGLISLVIMAWENNFIQISTFVVSGCAGIAIDVTLLSFKDDTEDVGRKIVVFGMGGHLVFLFLLGTLMAFYSDWVLAGVAGNMVGVPSGDNIVLYLIYFIAKRLPLFSI